MGKAKSRQSLMFSFLFIIVIVPVSHSRVLNACPKYATLQLVLRDIVLENSLKGLLINDRSPGPVSKVLQYIMNDIVRHAVNSTSVTSVSKLDVKLGRFFENVPQLGKGNGDYRFKRNLAARDDIFIVAFFPILRTSELAKETSWIDCVYTSPQSVMKTLMVIFTPKKYKTHIYRDVLKIISKAYVFNVDILEIVASLNKPHEHVYRVFQYNPFKDSFKHREYKRGAEL